MDPEIKGKICYLFKLPPEHDLIKQTELCLFRFAAATTFREHKITCHLMRLLTRRCDYNSKYGTLCNIVFLLMSPIIY